MARLTIATAGAALRGTTHLIDAGWIAPGVLRVTVTPGTARAAAAAMIRAGFDAARRGDAQVTVTA